MRAMTRLLACGCGVLWAANVPATTIVYQNDFDAPSGFIAGFGGYTDVSQQSVNTLFGSTFQQTNTVETIRITGSALYSDPSGTGGSFALGMLSTVQDDKLALTFDVGALSFVNVQLDISGIDLQGPSAPFGPEPGVAPTFKLQLFDTPGGSFGFGTSYTELASATIVGTSSPRYEFDWSRFVVPLSTSGNTDGQVTLQFDLLSGNYAGFDNLVIASSEQAGVIPEPETYALLLAGLGLLGVAARRRLREPSPE